MILKILKSFLLLIFYIFSFNPAIAQIKAKGKTTFLYYPDSKIEIIYDDKKQPYEYKIVKGRNTVFEYNYVMDDDSNIADDEYRERLIFEIGPKTRSFLLKDAEMRKANTFYYWSCFCADAGNHIPEKGSISGKRFGRSRWMINIDISYISVEFPDWPRTLVFDQQYYTKTRLKDRKEW